MREIDENKNLLKNYLHFLKYLDEIFIIVNDLVRL